MDLGLKGKVALVAASSRGLGRAVARSSRAEGADLVMCARGADALREARDGDRARTGARVRRRRRRPLASRRRRRVVDARALREFGRVDMLVTNAGGPPAGPFESHSRRGMGRRRCARLSTAWSSSRAPCCPA